MRNHKKQTLITESSEHELSYIDREMLLSADNFFQQHPEAISVRDDVMKTLQKGGCLEFEIKEEIEDFHFRNTLSKYVKNDVVKFFDPDRLRSLLKSFFYEKEGIESPEDWLKQMEDEYYDYCDFNGDVIQIFSSVSKKRMSEYNDGSFEEEFSVQVAIYCDDNEEPLLISLYLTEEQADSTTHPVAEMLVSIKDLKREEEDQLLASIESGASWY
jgi:hypothetical protein